MENLNRHHLNGLRALAAVAQEGSLSGAARLLNVSPGAVSQQVTRAEAALGLRLFDRRPEGMRPTARGAEVLRLLDQGFGLLSSAVERATQDRSRILTISVAPIFAARWMIWRLPDFQRQHPEIQVRLDNSLALVDPNTSDIDFCIRIGRGNYPGTTVEHLLTQYVVPVSSPAMAGRIRVPADFANVPIVAEPHPQFTWDAWLNPEGLDRSILPEPIYYPDASLCFDAAMAGAGVFLAFETLFGDALARGTIVMPIPRMHANGLGYWLVSARDQSLTEPQRAFRGWLKGALKDSGLGRGTV